MIPCEWPNKWVTGIITPTSGVMGPDLQLAGAPPLYERTCPARSMLASWVLAPTARQVGLRWDFSRSGAIIPFCEDLLSEK